MKEHRFGPNCDWMKEDHMGQASWMPLLLTKIVVLDLGCIWCSTALGVILLHPAKHNTTLGGQISCNLWCLYQML